MTSFVSSLRHREKKRQRIQATINIVVETITIVNGSVPFPPAQAALESLCALLRIAITYMENEESISVLAERCQRIGYIIRTAAEGQKLEEDERMVKAIEGLASTVTDTAEIMKKKLARSRGRKLLHVFDDAGEIETLDSTLTQFITEFQLQAMIIVDMNVREVLQWVKAQDNQKSAPEVVPPNFLFTPSRPAIFFGRDEVVNACVSYLLGAKHVALIGAGGMGKSTIAKAVLNEEAITAQFKARLFITYDGIASSAMTYQMFLGRIEEALRFPASSSASSLVQHLQTLQALLVIDNAETFLGASQTDATLIHRFMEDIGSHSATRIIMTTRNTETIPLNLPWSRVDVSGLDAQAAHKAFDAIYPMDPIDSKVAQILFDLGHHPLSINLLANAAVMNSWDAIQLQEAWEERQTDVLNLAESDKNRSLPATIEISIASFKNRAVILQILQTIAFLPQGIDRDGLRSTFPSLLDISRHIEAICRSSLIYRNGTRLTMLAPIRMYIADRYNNSLPYDSPVLADTRAYYHSKLSYEAHDFIEREHGNIDRLLYFDMSSELYFSNIDIHFQVLTKADCFLFCSIEVVQRSSLWPLLVSETRNKSFSQVDAFAQLISVSLNHICWMEYSRNPNSDALPKLDVVEKYCRDCGPVCDEGLVRCLRLRGAISQAHGDLITAAKVLLEASSMAKSRGDSIHEAALNDNLARVLLSRGEIAEAEPLLTSAQEYYESNNEQSHLSYLLLLRGQVDISQKNFSTARVFFSRAMELDNEHNSGRIRLYILIEKASCEGWSGNLTAAKTILEEATKVKIDFGTPQFNFYVHALRGMAYYEARLGKLDDARRTIAHSFELQQETGWDWWNDIVFACIEALSDEGLQHAAERIVQKMVDKGNATDKSLTVICYKMLGEIMVMKGRVLEAKAQFEQAKAVCDESGMSPRHLYVNISHWYSLPEEFDGWIRFLDGHL